MKRGSFRLRLTLWNVAILGLCLVVFAFSMIGANQSRVAQGIDRDLLDQAMRMSRGGPPPFRQGGPNGGQGQNGNPGEGGPRQGPGQPGPGQLGPDQPQQGQGQGRQFGRGPGMRGDPRIVRFIGPDGKVIDPPATEPFDAKAFGPALRSEPIWSTVTAGGVHLRVVSVRWPRGDETDGIIQVSRDLTDFDRLQAAQMGTLLILLPLALLAAGFGAMFLTNRALKPIAEVTKAAAEISEKDLSRRLPVTGNDEMTELSSTFNGMIGRLETSFEGLKESFENQRRFTADASHELRTPLTRLRLATSSALEPDSTPEDYKKALQVADKAANSMSALVQQLLMLSRADAGQLGLQTSPVDCRVIASDAISATPGLDARMVEVHFAEDACMVNGDESHLQRVIGNLLENAVRYTKRGGHIDVAVSHGPEEVVMEVKDDGEGIEPEHLQRVFDRFYRADPARSAAEGGTGLGLAICKSIVEAHRGTIDIKSSPGPGTTVRVVLPAAH